MNRPLPLTVLLLFALIIPASAQLQISEVMYDTASDEGTWEWFEVVNAGPSDVDLDGYVFDDFNLTNNAQTEPNIIGVGSGGLSAVTEIPAGGVAVIYNGNRLEYNEQRFRSAWRLDSSVPLIGVSDFEALNNDGDTFGIWPSLDAYNSDLENTDEDEALEVSTFNAAAAWLDYAAPDFPSATDASIEWNGSGDYQDGTNWITNTEEVPGIVASIETLLPISLLNSLDDIASPGATDAVGSASGLVITEVLYNPASSEPSEWEFFELLNATGSDIDFSATPHFFDDEASGPLSEPNINSGSIADGEIAVLFRDTTSLEDMQAAWGDDVNLISVGSWSALNNTNDTVGIWDSVDAYNADSPPEGVRTFDEVVASVNYGLEDWPEEGNGESINLVDFGDDVDDPSNWVLSSAEDGISTAPEPVFSSNLVDHVGGDLGTPGSFGDVVVDPVGPPAPGFSLDVNADGAVNATDAPLLCDAVTATGVTLADELTAGGILAGDADLNGAVEFADFLALSSSFGGQNPHFGQGDFDCNGAVEFADFLTLSSNFGQSTAAVSAESASVPEPASALLLGLVAVGLLSMRRSR